MLGLSVPALRAQSWDAATQAWRAYFPAGAGVPGANDLTALRTGSAYWVAISGPGPVIWPIAEGD